MNKTCVVGLGYVGLPLIINASLKGVHIDGYDIDTDKVSKLNTGMCYLNQYSSGFQKINKEKHTFSDDPIFLCEFDSLIICVPTPVDQFYIPDHSYIDKVINRLIELGHLPQLIVLESTVAPGYTREYIVKKLESNFNKTCGNDFHVCFSPEREDPGNKVYTNIKIPKVVGGYTSGCFNLCSQTYSLIFDSIIKASSLEAAELTKLHENTFRAINIAYVNQLRDVTCEIGIDFKEVIDLASSKPFGFTRFEPSNGVGGHCIPIDPYFLMDKFVPDSIVHKSMSYIKDMPKKTFDWIEKTSEKNDKFIVIGLGYKDDVDDMRNSPNLQLLELLSKKYETYYYDPLINTPPSGANFIELDDICSKSFKILISNASGEALMLSIGIDIYYDTRYQKKINVNTFK